MKIVHISTSDRGGAGIAAVRLHLSLLEKNVDSHLLTLYQFGPTLPNHVTYANKVVMIAPLGWLKDFIIKVKRKFRIYQPAHDRKGKKYLKGRGTGFENFSFPDGLTRLEHHPLVKSADIIHLHWVSEGMLDWLTFFSACQKPLIWTLHDMNPFTGGCHHADDCTLFQSNCSLCPQLKGTIDPGISHSIWNYKAMSVSGLKKSQLTITAPSHWLTQLSQKSKLFSNFKHITIANGVNHSVFHPVDVEELRKKYSWSQGKKVILFVAHHVNNIRKGIPFLLEAFQNMNHEEVVLCSVGNPSEELSSIPGFYQLGYVQDESTMAALYSMADVFVLPSMAENFPNTIAEALCCGTPCVAFEVGGIPEQINSGNGVLVKEKNAVALRGAIEQVLNTNFSREQIAADAKLRFGQSLIADAFISLYRKGVEA